MHMHCLGVWRSLEIFEDMERYVHDGDMDMRDQWGRSPVCAAAYSFVVRNSYRNGNEVTHETQPRQ